MLSNCKKIAKSLLHFYQQWHCFRLEAGPWLFNAVVNRMLITRVRVFGDPRQIHTDSTNVLCNTLFNTMCGEIYIGNWTFCSQNVSILTGTHDPCRIGRMRQKVVCESKNDIVIGDGVWLCSNCTILGPCLIGDNAVIAAGAVVTPRTVVSPNSIWGGVPARLIGKIAVKDEVA